MSTNCGKVIIDILFELMSYYQFLIVVIRAEGKG